MRDDPAGTIAAKADELTVLWPALAAALERDNGAPGPPSGPAVCSAGVVNADVLHAVMTLQREIPAARDKACDLIREPRQPRPVLTCLTALPRLAGRLHALGHTGAENRIARDMARWTVLAKSALGLRVPDRPIGRRCPLCADAPILVTVGAEGFLRPAGKGVAVEWQHSGCIRCPGCEASWTVSQWPHLGRLLESSPSSPTPRRSPC